MIGKQFNNEDEVQEYAAMCLGLFCKNVRREYWFHERVKMRVDVAAITATNHPVYVECKAFTVKQNCAHFVDAIDQAASYAREAKWPFFVGPVFGSPMELSDGFGSALAGAHLVAGRMNVGFLWVNRKNKSCGLMLRGQSLVSGGIDQNAHANTNIDRLFVYHNRAGSKSIKTGVTA